MRLAAKVWEALGLACVMIGLAEGVAGNNMWMELYLSIIGICFFLVGRRMEKSRGHKEQARPKS